MEPIDKGIEPIYPCMYLRVGEGSKDFRAYEEGEPKDWRYPMGGLTKREYFAGLALQGLLANPINADISCESLIKSSVEYADDLLKELQR